MTTIWLIVALLVAGLVLIFVEILTPTIGILIAVGLAAFAGALWQCYTLSPIAALVMLISLVIVVPIYLTILVKWLPRSPLGKRLFLRKAAKAGTGVPEADRNEALVGKTGVAESLMRPAGAIRIEGRRVIASAESGVIEKGQKVKVIRAEGMNVVVRLQEDDA